MGQVITHCMLFVMNNKINLLHKFSIKYEINNKLITSKVILYLRIFKLY